MPRLVRTQVELEHEWDLHGFGMRRSVLDAVPQVEGQDGGRGPLPHAGESRTILGLSWPVPHARTGYPYSWAEFCAAPWPFRVREALRRVQQSVWRTLDGERGQACLQACLAMPRGSRDDALAFATAVAMVPEPSSPEVLARLRAIVRAADVEARVD